MPETLIDIKFVGPATEPVLEGAGIEVADIRERRVSHAQLVEAGVHPGVAAKIRREHSLSWSLEGGEDLDRRAEQVRGLKDGEREWVAASATDWEDTDQSTGGDKQEPTESEWTRKPWPNQTEDDTDFQAEVEWRKQSAPKPLSAIDDIDSTDQSRLEEAGITSVRRLATCDPTEVATSLDLDESNIRSWRDVARESLD